MIGRSMPRRSSRRECENEDETWLRGALNSLAGSVGASAGVSWSWDARGRTAVVATGSAEQRATEVVEVLFKLPRASFHGFHRVPRGLARVDRQLQRLPSAVADELRRHMSAWLERRDDRVHVLAPFATRRRGFGLLLAVPAGAKPGPRRWQTLRRLGDKLGAAYAVRTRPRRTSQTGDGPAVWRDLMNGKWAVVQSERTATTNSLVLVRAELEAGDEAWTMSPRERQILALALEGRSNKWIGWTLGIGTPTVAWHLARANRKLGLTSRSELLAFFGPPSQTLAAPSGLDTTDGRSPVRLDRARRGPFGP